jgi:hypothetical protein
MQAKVISLQEKISILLPDVSLCMFTATATASAPTAHRSWAGVPIAHVQPKEGMER